MRAAFIVALVIPLSLVFAIVIFTSLFLIATERNTNIIGRVLPDSPAAAAHVHAGDRILTVAGQTAKPNDIPKHIRATDGHPFKLVVERKGERVVLGPLRARRDTGGRLSRNAFRSARSRSLSRL